MNPAYFIFFFAFGGGGTPLSAIYGIYPRIRRRRRR